MTKRLLLFACLLMAIAAQAQTVGLPNFYHNSPTQEQTPQPLVRSNELKQHYAGKATAGPSMRWYNYGDYYDTLLGSINTRLYAFMIWNDTMSMITYNTGPAHNTKVSLGTTLDFTYAPYNDPTIYPGLIAVTASTPYIVDSLDIWGAYNTNPSKASVVDTLILAVTSGNGTSSADVFIRGTVNPAVLPNYGVSSGDTLWYANLHYDSVKNTQGVSTTTYTFKYVLNSSNRYDTVLGGLWNKQIALPTALNVPAGNMVGVTISFKSGDASFTPHDSVFHSGVAQYNVFRPLLIYKAGSSGAAQWPPYTRDNYNNGVFKQLPSYANGWGGNYVPMYFWSSGSNASVLQHAYLGVHVNCATCTVPNAVNNAANAIAEHTAYPNPAHNKLNLSFTLKQPGTATAYLMDITGKTVAQQLSGNAKVHNLAFNTTALKNGIYTYYIVADNGTFVSGKVTIAN
ncbi:MAG: T9SS C-terminal target domain-containing protein [Chitinophagia bacterium]|nr:T9SS C-terminal target domain-containing protein [Chitinophagia bacterium]